MKRSVVLLGLLSLPLLTLGIYCDEDKSTGDEIISFFSGDEFEDGPVIEVQPTYTPPTNSILEDLGSNSYTTPPTTNVATDEIIATPETIEIPSLQFNSYWVNQTDLDYTSSGTESYWKVQIVYGNDTQLDANAPASEVNILAQFQGAGTETVPATTDETGWATWTRAKTQGAEIMLIDGIEGDYPWNPLDMAFWESQPALSITADELQ